MGVRFEEFKVSEVLTVERAKSVPAKANLIDGDIPYVTRTTVNNGYMRTCGNKDKVNRGNCITIGGETAIAFYQPVDFVAGNNMCCLRGSGLSENQYLYLVGVLNVYAKKYSYSYARTSEKIKSEILYLPVIESSDLNYKYTVEDIDWDYMEKYIAELEQERIAELEQYLIATGLNDYTLTDEDKAVLSLSLSQDGVTKLQVAKMLVQFGLSSSK